MTTSAFIAELSSRALQGLANPPAAGSGVHQWLSATACLLHEAGYSQPLKLEMLYRASRGVGRVVSAREITGAVIAAEKKTAPITGQASANKIPQFTATEGPWPAPDPGHLHLLGKSGPGRYDLWERSPLRFEDEADHCEQVVDILFPGDPLLCMGKSKTNGQVYQVNGSESDDYARSGTAAENRRKRAPAEKRG